MLSQARINAGAKLSLTYQWLLSAAKSMAKKCIRTKTFRFLNMCEFAQHHGGKSSAAIAEFHHAAMWAYITDRKFGVNAFGKHPELLLFELSRLCKLHCEFCYLALAASIVEVFKTCRSGDPRLPQVEKFLEQYDEFEAEDPRDASRAAAAGSCIFNVFDGLRDIVGRDVAGGIMATIKKSGSSILENARVRIAEGLSNGCPICDVPVFVNIRAQTRSVALFQHVSCLNFQMFQQRYSEMIVTIARNITDIKFACRYKVSSEEEEINIKLNFVDSITSKDAPEYAKTSTPSSTAECDPTLPPKFIIDGMNKFWRSRGSTTTDPEIPKRSQYPLVYGKPASMAAITASDHQNAQLRRLEKAGVSAARAFCARASLREEVQ